MFRSIDALSAPRTDPARHVVLGTPLDLAPGAGQALIFLAAGCFWGVEKIFWETPGVVSTAVGYMGGHTAHPTYPEVCTGSTGHAETVRVVYDTAQVSTEQILALFFEIHDPTQGDRQGNDVGPQYRSAVWTTTPDQRAAAIATRDAYQREISSRGFGSITTAIASSVPDAGGEGVAFWRAEDYHQGYLWKNPGGYQCHVRTGVACPVVPGARR